MTEIKKLKNIFKKEEIQSIQSSLYNYINKKKVAVYVPLQHVDKLTFEMGNAGAGIIGNYDLCSFRMKGLGTFRPNQRSNPYSGKKNQLSFEEEVRLEMECNKEELEGVLDAMLESHPYDEVAYEVYDFTKRGKVPSGYIINLKRRMKINNLVSRIKKNIDFNLTDMNFSFKKIVIINKQTTDEIIEKSLKSGCELIISKFNNTFNFKKL
ncbi:MAG: hypothetical protein ISS16_09375 [Ignavibacteria bacterium]|nr:hypothetical protein [Ignavibacteria bacterium]